VGELSAATCRSQIVKIVMGQGNFTVAELIKEFYKTETSIRRHLTLLEGGQCLQRVHGGAIAVAAKFPTYPFTEKMKIHIQAKAQIGSTP